MNEIDKLIKQENSKSRANKRKASRDAGLKEVTIQFDNDTMEALTKLCVSQSYELNRNNTGHCFSNVIGALIRTEAESSEVYESTIIDTPNKASQELYRIHKIILFLSTQQREDSDIVSFLKNEKYLRPDCSNENFKLQPSSTWREVHVKKLKREVIVNKRISNLKFPDTKSSDTTSKKRL